MNDGLVNSIAQEHHGGGDGTALWPQQQQGPRPFCSFGWEQRGASRNGPPVNGGLVNSIAQGHHSGGGGTALWTQQQQGPRSFCSFDREKRGACRNGAPVNGGLANSIAHGQAQRDIGVDDQEEGKRSLTEVDCHGGPLSEVFGPPESGEQQRTTTEMDCHGGPVSEVSRPPEATASLARGGLPLQARHQRRL